MMIEVFDPTTRIPVVDIPTGVFSLNVPAGWKPEGIVDSDLIIHNPSDVMLRFSKNVDGTERLLIFVHDYGTLLTRMFTYQLNNSVWEVADPVRYDIILPPSPDRVLGRLKTAKFPVVVIDAETLAQSTNASFTSLGAVCGDLATGEVFTWFQTEFPAEGQVRRDVELGTVQWWRKQYRAEPLLEVLEILRTEPAPTDAVDSMVQFTHWFELLGEYKKQVEVFANGPEFDSANLDTFYRQLSSQLPWQFRRNQSVRTMVLLGRRLLQVDPKYKERPGLIEHFSLHDALREFQYSSEIYRLLELKCSPLVVVHSEPNWEVVDAGNAGETTS